MKKLLILILILLLPVTLRAGMVTIVGGGATAAAPPALDFQETFDGSTLCYTGGPSTCDSNGTPPAWTTAGTDAPTYPSFQGTGLEGTYALYMYSDGNTRENYVWANFTSRSTVYVTFRRKANATPAWAGNNVNISPTGATWPPVGHFRNSATAGQYHVQANGGTVGSNFEMTDGTEYYVKLRVIQGTGANAQIACWISSDGQTWGSIVSESTNGTNTSAPGAIAIYKNTTADANCWERYDDIRTSGSDISY